MATQLGVPADEETAKKGGTKVTPDECLHQAEILEKQFAQLTEDDFKEACRSKGTAAKK